MTGRYGFGTTMPVPYEEAIPRVKAALKAEGFGVLTEIDVRQTLREKLGQRWSRISFSESATRLWHTRRLSRNQRSGCSCRATWWYVPSMAGAASK